MLFSSFEFIFAFLPITFVGYFWLNSIGKYQWSKVWLLIASLCFYGWWNPKYVLLILVSIIVNYGLHLLIKKNWMNAKKRVMLVGVVANVCVLAYYKYADFFIENFNLLSGLDFNLFHIILPLGISFFTFQQIAFLVDSYKDVVKEIDLLDYALFVSFFPQLIAGPIVHHGEMMPQFKDEGKKKIDQYNISKGLLVFNMGLAKKVVIADTFGKVANYGFNNAEMLGTMDSWVSSLFYSLQLYFDFSGYSDMAIGIGLFFNIVLPNNFWSPYKSQNIKEFWRRWHMTLSRFLRDYIYIPLGGNRKGALRTNSNLVLTFLIGGIWHGAGWNFVLWGLLHGIGLVVHGFFQRLNLSWNSGLKIVITFLFVNLTWVFFRASHFNDAVYIIQSMFVPVLSFDHFILINQYYDFPIWILGVILLFSKNVQEFADQFILSRKMLWLTVVLVIVNLIFMNSSMNQEFLYFDF